MRCARNYLGSHAAGHFLIAEVLLSFASAIRRCATKAEARQKDRNRVEQAFWAVRATNSMQWLA